MIIRTKRSFLYRFDTWLIIGLFSLYYLLLFLYARTLITGNEAVNLVITAAVPFLLSALISLYLSNQSSKEIEKKNLQLEQLILSLPTLIQTRKIICHGTKHGVPQKEVFWNNLLTESREKFILLGRTNKSWVSKSTEQSSLLGNEIIKIVKLGGAVKVSSDDNANSINSVLEFFRVHVYSHIDKLKPKEAARLLHQIKSQVIYCAVNNSNVKYAAVVSDNRLIIIPTLNSFEFRDEGMVLEIIKERNSYEFDTYTSDIERIFSFNANQLENINANYKSIIDAKQKGKSFNS